MACVAAVSCRSGINVSSALLRRCHQPPTVPPRTPDLVYIPQVWRWLKTKVGFKVLRKAWDPDFSEGAFIYGSQRAICRLTELIGSGDKDDELPDLVTPRLAHKLRHETLPNLSKLQRSIIVLRPPDIKLLVPIQVRLKEPKQCSVSMRALAVKWQHMRGTLRLAIVALQTEFIRDYMMDEQKQELPSQWTVDVFDVLECGIVGEAQQPHNHRPR